MCGIAGIVGRRALESPESLAALAHRGPDGEGSITVGPVWLGHRRLAIIDLSDAGAQPMTKEDCGSIVFNGEIYDHETHRNALESEGVTFDGRSDTEVLLRGLARKGPAFLRDLHGMYAFAWLHPQGRVLWLARDHAGMKPLYLWRSGGQAAFASELRALATAVRSLGGELRPRAAAFAEFLAWGSVPEPGTALAGIEMVAADTAIAIDVERGDVVRTERTRTVRPLPSEAAPVEAVQRVVSAAVSRHLVADTPVALFLSGGIDSSVLAIEAANANRPAPCAITVMLGSRGTHDEPELARTLSRNLGIDLRVVPVDDWMRRLDGIIDAFDQPSVDGMNTYLISGVARDLGFKVALSGIGADEVFGGYRHLRRHAFPLARIPGAKLAARLAAPAMALSARASVRRLGAILEGAKAREPLQRSWRRLCPDSLIRKLLTDVPSSRAHLDLPDPLRLEQATYLRDTLLRDTDVMGMARGVEIRAPFLDPDVLGVAEAIGSARILDRDRPPKWLLRDGWQQALMSRTLARRKTGFTLDVAAWLRGPGRALIQRTRDGLATQRFVDRRAAGHLLDVWESRLNSGHPASWVPLFALAQILEQLRRWGEPA